MERQIPEIQITPPHWLPRGCFANSYPCVDSFSFSCLFSPSFSLSFFPLPFLYIYIFFLVLMAEETKKSFAPPRSPQFEATGNSEVKFNFSSSTNFDSSKLPEIKEVDYWDDMGDDLIHNDEEENIFDFAPTTVLKYRGKKFVNKVNNKLKTDIPTVKLRDKLSFFFGVWSVIVLVFILGHAPQYFGTAYGIQFFTLIPIRFYVYKKLKWHYFLFDFCYFANFLLLLFLFVLPEYNMELFRNCFAFCAGPLPVAILAWKNSLVFHSLDKLTSLFIHIVPATQVYLVRWVLSEEYLGCPKDLCDTTFFEMSVVPLWVYLFWQVLYFIKIEVFSAEKVKSKGYITSSSWMISDPKSIVNTLLPERFQSRRSKLIGFMLLQFAYTFVSLIPSWVCWHSQLLHTLFLMAFIAVSIWNGGSFYIEVFAVRYVKGIQDAVHKNKEGSETKEEGKEIKAE